MLSTEQRREYETFTYYVKEFSHFISSQYFVDFLVSVKEEEILKWNKMVHDVGEIHNSVKNKEPDYERIHDFNILAEDFFDNHLIDLFAPQANTVLKHFSQK